jgi:hypothetical protein
MACTLGARLPCAQRNLREQLVQHTLSLASGTHVRMHSLHADAEGVW